MAWLYVVITYAACTVSNAMRYTAAVSISLMLVTASSWYPASHLLTHVLCCDDKGSVDTAYASVSYGIITVFIHMSIVARHGRYDPYCIHDMIG